MEPSIASSHIGRRKSTEDRPRFPRITKQMASIALSIRADNPILVRVARDFHALRYKLGDLIPVEITDAPLLLTIGPQGQP